MSAKRAKPNKDGFKPCPFCGETDEIHIVTDPFVQGTRTGEPKIYTKAFVECGHCCARGTSLVEQTTEEAIEGVKKYWNEAKR